MPSGCGHGRGSRVGRRAEFPTARLADPLKMFESEGTSAKSIVNLSNGTRAGSVRSFQKRAIALGVEDGTMMKRSRNPARASADRADRAGSPLPLRRFADLGVPGRRRGHRDPGRLDQPGDGAARRAGRSGDRRPAQRQLRQPRRSDPRAFRAARGEPQVVQAQITGSIIGTSLLGLGLAIVVGCIGRDKQTFKRERAGPVSTMLILVLIALLLPAVFDFTGRRGSHRPPGPDGRGTQPRRLGGPDPALCGQPALHAGDPPGRLRLRRRARLGRSAWPIWLSLVVLLAATALIASRPNSCRARWRRPPGPSAVDGVPRRHRAGPDRHRVGPVRGLLFARQDKMGLVLNIASAPRSRSLWSWRRCS